MEVTNALLVAMMFVMILSIGIGNILLSLPPLIDRDSGPPIHWIPVSWLVLLLMQHLNLFWQTLAILETDEWRFGGFLYVLAGPILLYLATSFMLPDPNAPEKDNLLTSYFRAARRFFLLLALLMMWTIGVDLVFGEGWTRTGSANAAFFLVFVALALSQHRTIHTVGTVAIWASFLSVLTLRGLGVVG